MAGDHGPGHGSSHGPAQGHGGGHAGHSHGVSADADFGKLAIALALILTLMCVEVVVGILALLSDAAHMLTDAGAIGLSTRRRSARVTPRKPSSLIHLYWRHVAPVSRPNCSGLSYYG